MKKKKIYNVVGIMTGTSMDGIDISYCSTDGVKKIKIHNEKSYQYSKFKKSNFKNISEEYKKNKKLINKLNLQVSILMINYINKFKRDFKINNSYIDFISLSGQTILHIPKKKITVQLGDANYISNYFKLNVVSNFRINDILNGGQGAPIGAYYHKLLINKINRRSVIINLGGVANFSVIYNNKFFSSDIGPANAISDDLMFYFFNKKYDKDGKFSSKGNVNKKILKLYKNNSFFKKKFPKSLDRDNFHYIMKKLIKLKPYDAINTSMNFTIYSIIKLLENKICSNVNEVIFTGGGRKNKYLFKSINKLKKHLKINTIDYYGFNGDLIEAQMFAYIGVRSIKGYILSSPLTTGVKKSISGGNLYKFIS